MLRISRISEAYVPGPEQWRSWQCNASHLSAQVQDRRSATIRIGPGPTKHKNISSGATLASITAATRNLIYALQLPIVLVSASPRGYTGHGQAHPILVINEPKALLAQEEHIINFEDISMLRPMHSIPGDYGPRYRAGHPSFHYLIGWVDLEELDPGHKPEPAVSCGNAMETYLRYGNPELGVLGAADGRSRQGVDATNSRDKAPEAREGEFHK